MAEQRLFTFDGSQEAWVLGGGAGTKSITIGADAGYVYSGTESGALICQANSGDEDAQVTVTLPVNQIVSRFRTFVRFAVNCADDEFNFLQFMTTYYDGAERKQGGLRFDSAYGVTDEVQIYHEPATWEDITTGFPWALFKVSGGWNEVEIIMDIPNDDYNKLRINNTYSYAPTVNELNQVADATKPSLVFSFRVENTTTSRTYYIDRVELDALS